MSIPSPSVRAAQESQKQLARLQSEIEGLRATIARRESQQGNAPSAGQTSNPERFIASARAQLQLLALDFVTLKCCGLGWDPLELYLHYKPGAAPVKQEAIGHDKGSGTPTNSGS